MSTEPEHIPFTDPRHPWSGLPPEQLAYLQAQEDATRELAARYPGLPAMTLSIMGGDLASMRHWRAKWAAGDVGGAVAVAMTGSYYRWALAIELVQRGGLDVAWLDENIAGLWTGSDPDDTLPVNLAVWRDAWRRHGRVPIRDGKPLPAGRRITVFRGGATYEPGCAWTTNPKIAGTFARGAGLRVPIRGGTVVRGTVDRRDVLAYLTGRGEFEVIVDPRRVALAG